MAPKGGSGGGGGKVTVTGGGGGGGGGDNSISVGEAIAIVVGIIGGPILIVFAYCVIKDGLKKFQKRLQRRAVARMQGEGEGAASVELGQPLPAQDPPQVEQLVAAPEPTHPHFDKMLCSGSLSVTHPTTPAYDTGDLYRPS